jgi:hypothetical protein
MSSYINFQDWIVVNSPNNESRDYLSWDQLMTDIRSLSGMFSGDIDYLDALNNNLVVVLDSIGKDSYPIPIVQITPFSWLQIRLVPDFGWQKIYVKSEYPLIFDTKDLFDATKSALPNSKIPVLDEWKFSSYNDSQNEFSLEIFGHRHVSIFFFLLGHHIHTRIEK